MTPSEILAGIGAVKTAFDLAKALKDIDDAARRNSAVIDLQQQILIAQETQTALLAKVNELKKEVADFKTWETEKQSYDLVSLGFCTFAYMLKPFARGTKPAHWVCTKCFNDRQVEVIQEWQSPSGRTNRCPRCKTTYNTDDITPEWEDR